MAENSKLRPSFLVYLLHMYLSTLVEKVVTPPMPSEVRVGLAPLKQKRGLATFPKPRRTGVSPVYLIFLI